MNEFARIAGFGVCAGVAFAVAGADLQPLRVFIAAAVICMAHELFSRRSPKP